MGYRFASFLSQDEPVTLIVYGQTTEPAHVLLELEPAPGADPTRSLTNRYARLTPAADDLRLSSPGWIDIAYDQRMALAGAGDLFQLCRRKILNGVSPFAKPIRQFLGIYLDFVWRQTETNRDELEAFGPEGEVFGARDWVFSAWLPLPQARVLLPPDFDPGGPRFAEVDIAFWQGGRVKAVLIEGNSTPIRSKQRRLDYLREHHPHLDVITVARNRIASGPFPAAAFPPAFSRYWEGLNLPTGPAPPDI